MELALELFAYILLVVAGLIPIANPFSTAPVFIGMTAGLSKQERNQIANLAVTYMFTVLVVFLLLGTMILEFFGISLHALRIAGGLIVAVIGFRMLFEPDNAPSHSVRRSHDDVKKQAFTPLAMPMLSGPGSISVIMGAAAQISELETLADQTIGYAVVITGIALTVFICWVVLRASGSVVKFMGASGIDALTKVMGFLLVSIGVQFVITGIQGMGY